MSGAKVRTANWNPIPKHIIQNMNWGASVPARNSDYYFPTLAVTNFRMHEKKSNPATAVFFRIFFLAFINSDEKQISLVFECEM